MRTFQVSSRKASEIVAEVEDAVRSGALEPGAILPPVRRLAEELAVSPATVASAWRTLRERGVVVTDGRRGSRIAAGAPIAEASTGTETTWQRPRVDAGLVDLASGNPDPDLLPDPAAALGGLPTGPRLYGDAPRSQRLVRLARKRLESDGIAAEHLAVTSGALDGMERVLAATLRPGDRVAVEDPGWPGTIDLLRQLGLVPVPMRIDERGPLPEALAQVLGVQERGRSQAGAPTAGSVRAVIVTPRAHNPCGAALDAERAARCAGLLARAGDVLLLEDDHCAGVAGAPARTLVTSSTRHWAVVRSVAKSLGPDLRVAVVAGDADTIARVEGRQMAGMRWVSHILQDLVASMWSDASVRRSLERAERAYARRRQALLGALAAQGVEAWPAQSGLNVWLECPAESAAVQGLAARGWAVAPGERFRLQAPRGIRLTIARLAEDDADRLAADVAEVLVLSRRAPAV